MDEPHTKGLAEKIAAMISSESKKTDLKTLEKSIESLIVRIANIEYPSSAPNLDNLELASIHPSHERFNITEVIADSIFDKYAKEKTCTFEPNDKPCDHCSMCSSRGF